MIELERLKELVARATPALELLVIHTAMEDAQLALNCERDLKPVMDLAKAIASEGAVELMARSGCLATCPRRDCVAAQSCVMGPLPEEITTMTVALQALLESSEP